RSLSRFNRSSISKNPGWPRIAHHPPPSLEQLNQKQADLARFLEPSSFMRPDAFAGVRFRALEANIFVGHAVGLEAKPTGSRPTNAAHRHRDL
ncbi:MAG: hypothetical protein O9306_15625, partial [Beijerinckiaceae bacterium]|nr:hypothetical protein [Beijerinckiaceae bacterium]